MANAQLPENTATVAFVWTCPVCVSAVCACEGPKPQKAFYDDAVSAGGGLADQGTKAATASGTSTVDPVLCEIAYRWFCPRGGTVLDPFAGGSVRGIATLAKTVDAGLIFNRPPYCNPEVYSDDPADLTTLRKGACLDAWAGIITGAMSGLRNDRFAVWVIDDVRDAGGFFVNLPGKTVETFEAAGARFYNDAILVTAVGSLPWIIHGKAALGRNEAHDRS